MNLDDGSRKLRRKLSRARAAPGDVFLVARSRDHIGDKQIYLCFRVRQSRDLFGCGRISNSRNITAQEHGTTKWQIAVQALKKFEFLIEKALLVPCAIKRCENSVQVRSLFIFWRWRSAHAASFRIASPGSDATDMTSPSSNSIWRAAARTSSKPATFMTKSPSGNSSTKRSVAAGSDGRFCSRHFSGTCCPSRQLPRYKIGTNSFPQSLCVQLRHMT
jgi:hypothetical protein